MKRGNTKLVDSLTGLMQCLLCEYTWFANIKPNANGKYFRNSWQCVNDCNQGKSK